MISRVISRVIDPADLLPVAGGGFLPARFLPVLGFLVALLPAAALAQDRDVQTLSDQVQRLQRELTDLQRQVYDGAPSGMADGVAAGAGVAAGDTSVDASQEVRLQELETELRDLTGKVEEALFGVRQISERLDKLVADVEFRLGAIEQGEGGAPMAQAPTADAEGGAAPPERSAAADASDDADSAARASDPGRQTLGVLTQDQLEAFQSDAATPEQARPAPGSQTAAASPPAGTPEEQYDHAFGLLRQAKYAEAESALEGFIERFPEHALAGNAQYWLGETYYVRGDYTRAAVAFAEGYQNYPEGGKAADNLLKLGISLAAIDQTEDACRAFLELERRFPDAPANLKQRASRERQRHGCS